MADTFLNENRIGLLIWLTSNNWQSKLRKILKNSNISLNEYLILETLYKSGNSNENSSQIILSKNSCLDVSVVSTTLNLLEDKKFIIKLKVDNRSKKIKLTELGKSLVLSLINNIEEEENSLFNKLGNETFNFTNSLKLLLSIIFIFTLLLF